MAPPSTGGRRSSSLRRRSDRYGGVGPGDGSHGGKFPDSTAFPATDRMSGMSWITETRDGVILAIHATPRASKSQIQGLHGDALKIRLQAPPVDGKANDTLQEFLSTLLDIPRRQITLLSGQTSRQKRMHIEGITMVSAKNKIGVD